MSIPTGKNEDQLSLIPVAPVAPAADDDIGTRHVDMLEIAIDAARESGMIEAIDEALISVARANARALDTAEAMGKKGGYLIANLTGPYREVLAQLRMTPADRNKDADDDLAAALAALGTPSIRDA